MVDIDLLDKIGNDCPVIGYIKNPFYKEKKMIKVEDCDHDESERRSPLVDLSMEYCGKCGMWTKGPLVTKDKEGDDKVRKEVDE